MFKQKVNDYRITFRYSSYFHDSNHVNKKILELINDGVAKLAIDSSMRVYKLINNKLTAHSLWDYQTKRKYGGFS